MEIMHGSRHLCCQDVSVSVGCQLLLGPATVRHIRAHDTSGDQADAFMHTQSIKAIGHAQAKINTYRSIM